MFRYTGVLPWKLEDVIYSLHGIYLIYMQTVLEGISVTRMGPET